MRSKGSTRVNRSMALRAALDILRCSHADGAVVAERRRRRLVRLLQVARERSAFYQNLYARVPDEVDNLAQLPFVTKPELMRNFEKVVTDADVKLAEVEAFVADLTKIGEPYLGRYFVCTTSGTTGRPGIFIHDQFAWLIYQLLGVFRGGPMLVRSNASRLLTRSPRIALLAVGGGHFGGAAGFAWRQRTQPRLARLRRMVSVLDPISDQVSALNEFRPSLVAGYPSAVAVLAEEQSAGRLRINPALILLAGEWIAPASRRRIEQAFGCPARNFYGASECFSGAYECSSGWLHVNSDWVILEPVDRNYEPVAAGTPSHTVLLTNLANHIQPLIRYELGDSIVEKPDPCPCGRRLPAIQVEGRKSDVLTLQSATGGVIKILPLALATIVEETPGVSRFQAIQTGPQIVEFRLEVKEYALREHVWTRLTETVRAYLTKQGVDAVELRLSSESPKASPVSGKFQQIRVVPGVEVHNCG